MKETWRIFKASIYNDNSVLFALYCAPIVTRHEETRLRNFSSTILNQATSPIF